MKKKLIKIANQIVTYNKKAEMGDIAAQQKIEELMANLSLEEMADIDEYILNKKLLTK